MDSRVIAELVLHLGRIASGEGLVKGLTSAQWTVLRYFARANRFSRMPSAFAAFHGTTRGTASQTIKNLETQGYLTRMRSEGDGRSARLDLTDKARAILVNDLFEALVRAADALPPGVRGHFANALQRILGQVALKKRASANKSERQAWVADDLLFVSNYGEGDERQISFAHFSKAADGHDLPTLKVLGCVLLRSLLRKLKANPVAYWA